MARAILLMAAQVAATPAETVLMELEAVTAAHRVQAVQLVQTEMQGQQAVHYRAAMAVVTAVHQKVQAAVAATMAVVVEDLPDQVLVAAVQVM